MIRRGFALLLAQLVPVPSHAGYRVISPTDVGFGEIELEHNGASAFDRRPGNGGAGSQTIEFGGGLTPWWRSEIEFGFEREAGPNQPTILTQAVTENMMRLTEPGEMFANFGVYFEYGQSLTTGARARPNQITFGPVIGKDIGRTTHTINLFVTRQLGPGQTSQGLDLSYAWQSRWNLWQPFSPAIEIYGDAGTLGRSPRLSRQQMLIGPVGVGSLRFSQLGLGNAGRLKYEVGWLFGVTPASPQGVLRWRVELALPF